MSHIMIMQATWLGLSESFWGSMTGTSVTILVGIVGYAYKQNKQNKNVNTRTFSKINYDISKFINFTNQLNLSLEDDSVRLEQESNGLSYKLQQINIDILDAKEVIVFYEILNIVDDLAENAYREEELRDDNGNNQGSITHANPYDSSEKINKLEEKRKELIKDFKL